MGVCYLAVIMLPDQWRKEGSDISLVTIDSWERMWKEITSCYSLFFCVYIALSITSCN